MLKMLTSTFDVNPNTDRVYNQVSIVIQLNTLGLDRDKIFFQKNRNF